MFGNPSKEGYCFKLTKGLPEKMVANCLKLQTKAWLKEKKDNINKGEKSLATPKQQTDGALKSKVGLRA